MNQIQMRLTMVFTLLCLFTIQLYSQRTAFLFLQSEDGKPFYLKYEKKIYSSTVSGYLLLGKLPETELLIHVGFPGNSIPEIQFRLPAISNGKGVLMRSFGEKGWGLFDFQDASVIYEIVAETTTATALIPQNQPAAADPFANMLSDVTRDTTVKYVGIKPIETVVPKDLKKDSSTALIANNSGNESPANTGLLTVSTADRSNTVQSEVLNEPVAKTDRPQKKIFPRSDIAVQLNDVAAEGTNLLFLVSAQGTGMDTVKAFIPIAVESVDSTSIAGSKGGESVVQQEASVHVADSSATVVSVPPTEKGITADSTGSISGIHIQTASPGDSLGMANKSAVDTTFNPIVQPEAKGNAANQDQKTGAEPIAVAPEKLLLKDSVIVEQSLNQEEIELKENPKKNSSDEAKGGAPVFGTNCKKAATDEDFLKVRRKMAQQTKDEEMVNEAQKYFKNMCFTTEQIRNLGVLFLSEEGRYRFYDAALKSVLDPQHFSSLENTLLTPYYKKRFQALIPE